MKLLFGDRDGVDFDAPVRMNEEQLKDFLKLLKSLFVIVETKEVEEPRLPRIGDKFFMRPWSMEEKHYLLMFLEDVGRVAEKLGRSWMAVVIQRGAVWPDFLKWVDANGRDLLKEDKEKLVREFLQSKEAAKLRRQTWRNEVKRLQNEVARLENQKPQIAYWKRMGKLSDEEERKFYEKLKDAREGLAVLEAEEEQDAG